MRYFKTRRSFRKEFKRQLKFAIIAACGFTIAFAWREVIFNSVSKLAVRLTDSAELGQSPIFTAALITALGVFIILISSKLLKG